MKRKIIILITIVAALALCAPAAFAAEDIDQTISLPEQVEIAKDNDVSAAMLSKLLGTEWQIIAGSKAADALGGAGKWAGVFTKFLSILNTLALFFAAVSVLGHWGIFALESAHHGKAGGKIYNSLWVPVRQALSFSLCVPITGGGLSLLQVAIIGAVSLSINFANVVWDSLGGYLISHVQTGIVDNSAPFVDEESLNLIRPMFRAVVAQEILLAERPGDIKQVREKAMPDGDKNVNELFFLSVQSAAGGKYSITREPLKGTVRIYITGINGMSLGELGSVRVPAPIRTANEDEQLEAPDDLVQYSAMSMISEARVAAVIELWEGLREWARFYLSDPENGHRIFIETQHPKPEKDGLALARQYRDSVMNASETHLATLRSQIGVQKMLKKAVDSDGTESKLGWVSAGLMPYTFAQAQKRLDDLCFSGGAFFINVSNELQLNNVSRQGNASIANAYAWSSEALLQGRLYQPVDETGSGSHAITRLIAGVFYGSGKNSFDNEGILAGTLAKFRQVDPMVVIADFGRKCYTIGEAVATISLGSAALAAAPWVGDSLAAVSTSPPLVALMYLTFTLGALLFFLPPIAVLSAWIWAILKWALTIVYVLVGAPLWAVAHSAPEGPGFTGEHARQGYYIALDLVMRPALLTGGVVVSMAIWQVAADLYNTLLSKYLNGFSAFNGSGLIMELIFSAILFIIFGAIYLKVFTFCVNTGPNLVMDMFGRRGAASLDSSDHDGQHVTGAAGIAITKGAGTVTSLTSGTLDGMKGAASLLAKAKNALRNRNGGDSGITNIAPKQ